MSEACSKIFYDWKFSKLIRVLKLYVNIWICHLYVSIFLGKLLLATRSKVERSKEAGLSSCPSVLPFLWIYLLNLLDVPYCLYTPPIRFLIDYLPIRMTPEIQFDEPIYHGSKINLMNFLHYHKSTTS